MTHSLSEEELKAMDAYWRAANYLSVGQIYLYDNPLRWQDVLLLLRRLSAKFLFTPAGAKPRLRQVAAVDNARTL